MNKLKAIKKIIKIADKANIVMELPVDEQSEGIELYLLIEGCNRKEINKKILDKIYINDSQNIYWE